MEMNRTLLDTDWFHAANFIWLYDGTGLGWKNKSGIQSPVNVSITTITPPQSIDVLNKQERIAILSPKNQQLYGQKSKDQLRLVNPLADVSEENLRVNETDLQMPASPIHSIQGEIDDASGRFNPRYFSLTLSNLNPQDVATNSIQLFKNSAFIKRPAAGAVYGNLIRDTGEPAAWAILTLQIPIPSSATLEFHAQANQHGDFTIPLHEFPALEKNSLVAQFTAQLNIQAAVLVNGKPDLQQLSDLQIKVANAQSFLSEINFQISPGNQIRLMSFGSQSLVVKS